MYSTCLFCNKSLGANEAVEHFPVGRRLAFDSSKGRLWAVCRGCGRWNLSPLDERWEAIEECERLFAGTRLRASTDEIGLGRVADGTELVRIGAPPRGEFAAWRYGDQFGKRRQRMILQTGALVAIGVTMVATNGFGLLAAGGGSALWQVPNAVVQLRRANVVIARGTDDEGRAFVLRGKHLGKARFLEGGATPRLELTHDKGRGTLSGSEAIRVGALVLARVNATGAGKADVRKAVTRIEQAGGPEALLAREARTAIAAPKKVHWSQWDGRQRGNVPGSLKSGNTVDRLALEMALHEESERRALEGELGALAAEWKSAEEIARISDDMFLPESVNARLDALHEEDAHRGEPKRLLDGDDR